MSLRSRIIALGLIIALMGLHEGVTGSWENYQFNSDGKIAQIEAPKYRLTEQSFQDADLTFKTERGQIITVRRHIDLLMAQQLNKNGVVKINYLVSNPGKTRWLWESRSPGQGFILAATGILIMVYLRLSSRKK
ncbi:hypothetical protein ACO0LF_00715 [Undibacterium sp. Di27W]|uniref:hypothetical protein n=1 Tax=Undibacterium sp. Di27W TaxID=3413036 RepID=UPI003BF3D0DD